MVSPSTSSRSPWQRLRQRLRGTPPHRSSGLSTFLGVYTPTILTILGVILYLRLGWVVGHAGLLGTLAIVVVANLLTLATTLALSAVATNSRVGVGGAYYILSRSLGVEIGGAIGLPLFLSQAFSVTLYAFGLAEAFRFVWPNLPLEPAAFVIVAAVGALAFRGASGALRAQLPVMALIALSLFALAFGAFQRGSVGRLHEAVPSGEVGFWAIFAVFFPAVTGIMAGLGLSGDLTDPKRSIPRGTLAAQLTGFGIYLVIPVLLALAAAPALLRNDALVWTRIAPFGAWLVLPGLWGAIFSSAVGSMLAAPRTLQALAMDHIAPRRLAAVAGPRGEPLLGLGVSLVIALAAVLLGNLNAVAEVVTIFFLTVYGSVNLAAALEALSGDPSWRPTIRVPWGLSLAGALGCFGVMLLINAPATLAAIGVVLSLYLFLQRQERRADWGDVRRGVYEALIRWALVRLARRPQTPRSWRPHVLVFTEPSEEKLDLVRVGDWLSQDRGVVTVCELQVAELVDLTVDPLVRQNEIQSLLASQGIVAFAEVDVVPNLEDGIVQVAQANGIAGIESNTILIGWPDESAQLQGMLRVMERLERLHKSLVMGRAPGTYDAAARGPRSVHVWWGGLQRNGDLMLLLAYLLTRNREWRDASIRILSVASNELMKRETERMLGSLIPEIRISAQVDVFVKPPEESVQEVIQTESADADLVLLGLATPKVGEEAAYATRLAELVRGLRAFFFVKNNTLFIGDLVSAEGEGRPGKVPLPSPSRTPSTEDTGG